jgi:uncharacterized protein (TIGR02145 family)
LIEQFRNISLILTNSAMNPSIKFPEIEVLIISLALGLYSCKDKSTIPAVITNDITDITQTTAVSGGSITDDGGAEISVRGVCWSNTENPTTASDKTSNGTGIGSYISDITGLTAGIKYYVRAYATNSAGTAYGNQVSFTTEPAGNGIIFNPDIIYGTTSDIEGTQYKTVEIGTQIWMAENLKTTKYNDGSSIALITDNAEWSGLTTPAYCWYENDISNKDIYGALYNWYAVNRGNLCPSGWHIPTDAEWTILTTFLGGEDIAGGKLKETGTRHWNPNVDATNITGYSAVPGGFRGNSGSFFDMSYFGGYWWTADENWQRLIQSHSGSISSQSGDDAFGASVRCIQGEPPTTTLPVVTTLTPSGVTLTSAISGGTVESNAGASITDRGVCWSTVANPTTADPKTSEGTGAGSFISSIEGLAANTVYHLRAYAINSVGTAYGDEFILKTMTSQVTDIDGNIYYSVTIGTQEWLSENLKVTRYRNGDEIPNITDYTIWDPLTTGARSTNIYLPDYAATYGWYYNWYAVSDNRNICPTGWHVPSDDEWTTMTTYLGGESEAGGKLKEAGHFHWVDPNVGATNETGFTALGGEAYLASPGWSGPGYSSFLWTATEYDATEAWNRILSSSDAQAGKVSNMKRSGFSVRCIKD